MYLNKFAKRSYDIMRFVDQIFKFIYRIVNDVYFNLMNIFPSSKFCISYYSNICL